MFKNTTGEPRVQALRTDRLGSDVKMKLAEHGGAFICMATALEFIAEGDPIERLCTIQVGGLPSGGALALHRQILRRPSPTLQNLLKAFPGALLHHLPAESSLFLKIDSKYLTLAKENGAQTASAITPEQCALLSALHRARLIKTEYEIAQIRKAKRD